MLDANVNTTYTIAQRIFDATDSPDTTASPTVLIYDQATYTLQATITMTHRINGIYTCTHTFTAVGLYDICIDESTVPRHFYATVLVGNSDDVSLAAKILNIANIGQNAELGAGSGQVTYANILTYNGNPLQATEVRCFNAYTATLPNTTKATVTDTSSMVAKQTTNTVGSFTLYLNPGYYVLQFTDPNDGFNVWYINYNTGSGTWTTSTTPINP